MLVLAAVTLPGNARSEDGVSVEIAGVDTDGNVATVGLVVRTSDGIPVSGIPASEFAVNVNGTPAPVDAVVAGEDAALPIGLVAAIDTSGSMAGEFLAAAKSGVAGLVDALQPGDGLALLSFDQSVTEVSDFTDDKQSLLSDVDGLVAGGNTALYDAVTTAATVARGSSRPRHAVVFLADGEDFGGVSASNRDQAIAAAATAGVPFYVVGVGSDIDSGFLKQLANDTGGRYYDAATAADIGRLYTEVSAALRLEYALTVRLPAGMTAGVQQLAVTVHGASTTTTFRVEGVTGGTVVPNLQGLPSLLADDATIFATDVSPGTTLSWLVDGIVQPAADATLHLDPYKLAPGPHTVVVRYTDGGGATDEIEAPFAVAKLPPRILAPAELPELEPSDIIRVTVESQTGTASVSYLVDGAVVEVDESPPYEFVVPNSDNLEEADFTIRAADSHGDTTMVTTIAPASASSGAAPWGRLLGYLLLGGGFIVLGGGSFFWARSVRDARPPKPDFDGVGPVLDRWQRAGPPEANETVQPARSQPPTAWGTLLVLSGKLQGHEFPLRDDTELVGRGKFCSVRIDEGSIEPAHVLLNRDGTFRASRPRTSIEVDGTNDGWGRLLNGSTLRLGDVSLEFHDA